jgi:hypothetical protein
MPTLFSWDSNSSNQNQMGIEFLELELNSNSIFKYQGKKLCLGIEFLELELNSNFI